MQPKVRHVAVLTRNREKMVEFYQKVFRFPALASFEAGRLKPKTRNRLPRSLCLLTRAGIPPSPVALNDRMSNRVFQPFPLPIP